MVAITAENMAPAKHGFFGRMKVRGRLVAGFAAMVVVMAIMIAISVWQLLRIDDDIKVMNDTRVPSLTLLKDLQIEINDTAGALRGYVIFGRDEFERDRRESWSQIDAIRGKLDALAARWTVGGRGGDWQRQVWGEIKRNLDGSRAAQDRAAELVRAAGDRAAADPTVREALSGAVAFFRAIELALEGGRDAQGRDVESLIAVRERVVEDTEDHIEGVITNLLIIEAVLFVVGLIIAVVVSSLTARSIVRPLSGMQSVMGRIAAGEAEIDIVGRDRADELGDMARSLNIIRDTGLSAARLKSALDNIAAPVMVAGADNKIVYLNRAAQTVFDRNEGEVRKSIPGFSARGLLGSSIDAYHKVPSMQHRMIADMSGTHRTQLALGDMTFALAANRVTNDKGERLGTVVEWRDITAELAFGEEIAGVVQAAAAGDFDKRIATQGKAGIDLKISEAMNTLTTTVQQALNELAGFLSTLARGDLTLRIEGDYRGQFLRLKTDANATADQLSEIVTRIMEASDTIATGSSEISAGASDLSARTEQQASNLEETAASMEELAATVRQNSENAVSAKDLSASARAAAENGGKVAGEAIEAMSNIESSSQKITDIIGVIDEIAFQTNLLALNAAVEAARAGDAGKGFAVVAAEVRALAQRSAQASKEIKALIVASGQQVKTGVDLVRRAGSALSEINEGIRRVADIVAEIAAASQEQSSGLEQVNTAVSQMDETTQKNAALVEESAAAAKSMDDQARTLAETMQFFTVDQGARRLPPARQPAPRPAATPAPVRAAPAPAAKRKAAAPAKAGGDAGWQEF
jgi:methyl-accepting chemotaxis protein